MLSSSLFCFLMAFCSPFNGNKQSLGHCLHTSSKILLKFLGASQDPRILQHSWFLGIRPMQQMSEFAEFVDTGGDFDLEAEDLSRIQ